MAQNASNIYAAEPLAAGALYVAVLGTPGPTSATTILNPAFVSLGHVGEDGFKETTDRSIDKKKNFGGQTVKILQTDFTLTYAFTLLETLNPDVLKAVYGSDNVTVTAANSTHGKLTETRKNSKKLPRRSWVIDTMDEGLNAFYRNYIPLGQVISVGDVTVVHTDTIAYEVELEAFADASGNHVYTYTDDGALGS